MKKAIYLELTVQIPPGVTSLQDVHDIATARLNGTYNGLTAQVLRTEADPTDPSRCHIILYCQGDQPGPDDFKQFATNLVQQQWNLAATSASPGVTAAPAPQVQLASIDGWEGYDTWQSGASPNALLAANPILTATPQAGCFFAPENNGTAVLGTPLPSDVPRPAPTSAEFDTCPANGGGGDTGTNALKNRIDDNPGDSGWNTTTVGTIIALPVPPGLPTNRQGWSLDQQNAIAQFEGLPVQVVGFLAGARVEGPEACNCHSQDESDFHLWLVDAVGNKRDQSVVAEITPRVRANHPGWTIDQICSLATAGTQVRISGWLMMDPAHPDMVGNNRGTTWEIHPIIAIEVGDGQGGFTPLDLAVSPPAS